ncbi:hypothetical protein YB2330_004645 [Saitoella coloradoensis]
MAVKGLADPVSWHKLFQTDSNAVMPDFDDEQLVAESMDSADMPEHVSGFDEVGSSEDETSEMVFDTESISDTPNVDLGETCGAGVWVAEGTPGYDRHMGGRVPLDS